MAKQRARNYNDSKVRFGRGGSFAPGSEHEHLGVKDNVHKRSAQLNLRTTPAENDRIRQAFAESGSMGSFTEFAVGALIEGLEARHAGVSFMGTQSANDIEDLAIQLGERLDKTNDMLRAVAAVLDDVFRRQEALGKVGVAQAKQLAATSEAVAALTGTVERLGAGVEETLARAMNEGARGRKDPRGAP